jgi:hypothetical protein
VNKGLQRHFLPIFDHLYQIRESEGVNPKERCMGHSPFTSISITQDYHCNMHTDSNDFFYSFFVWLSTNGTLFFITLFLLLLFSLLLFLLLIFLLLIFHYLVLFCVGTTSKGQGVRFYLPKLKKFFEPEIGDVIFIKVSLIQHSTRTQGSVGQFGIYLYMQASFFLMRRAVQKDLRHMHKGKKLSENKLKKVNHWLTNNAEYVQSM